MSETNDESEASDESDEMRDLPKIVVESVDEHEDGSATFHFDLDEKAQKAMADLGIEFVMYCAAYQMDIQDALDLISREGKLKELQQKGQEYEQE